MPVDYKSALTLLESAFAQAEAETLGGVKSSISERFNSAVDVIFDSRTQAFREVLLGCILARIQDREIDIRQPYVNRGPNAFNGRTLDERTVNPFLQDKRIPSSKGPYLSVFRRSVEFNEATREGIRDKSAYDSFLDIIEQLASTNDESQLNRMLSHLLHKFIQLREEATVPLSRIQRMSLEQFDDLVARLLETPSGGRFPMLLVIAAFESLKEHFQLDWEISWQGINVSDTASGAEGDLSIKRDGEVIFAAEITERPVDRNRVVSTFNAKIAPSGIEDYLFFVRPDGATTEALRQARHYFAQGHELVFLTIKDWVLMILATMGHEGRALYTRMLLSLLDSQDMPAALKVIWNQQVEAVVASQGDGP